MEDNKYEGRYFLSELFYKESEESMAWIIFWLSISNLFMACITLVIIITQTPASMKSFRNLVLALLSVSIAYEIFNIFYKTAILLPLPIFISANPIRNVTNALNSFGPYIVLMYMSGTTDLLLCLLIQRYFTMSKNVVSHSKHLEKCVYGMVFITNFIMVVMLITSHFSGDRLNKQDTIQFVQEHIIDWEKLLEAVEYPAVITVFQKSDFLAIFDKCYMAFYGISRLFTFIFFTRLNMKIVFGTNETPQNRKQHQMIIRLLKFEFLAAMFLIIIPAHFLIFAIAFQIPYPMIPMYCALLLKLYPPLDMLLTSFLIKPYREFVKKVVFKLCRLKSASVNTDSSTPKINNAKINVPNHI
uniref:Uncharacterized protein n=1 Tax=Panagrolaimus davidi TaxID=227884 RepID=A0A914P6L4_9BILA